jgi:lipooligosaccharide transport system permease protein
MNYLKPPGFRHRIGSVWYRHMLVYTRNLVSNGLPSFMEPLIFLAGVGLGLGKFIATMEGLPYLTFLATGLLVTSAMFTAAFECSYGTYIRLEYDKVYFGMLAAPLKARDLILGELLWAGSKGFFFSLAVLIMMTAFGVIPVSFSLLAPFVGFLAGILFGAISLLVTSFVKNINHFNFYFTGVLSPMFFFSGVIFPVSSLPKVLQPIVWIMPLTHPVALTRALCANRFHPALLLNLLYMIVLTLVTGYFAVKRLRKRLVR